MLVERVQCHNNIPSNLIHTVPVLVHAPTINYFRSKALLRLEVNKRLTKMLLIAHELVVCLTLEY